MKKIMTTALVIATIAMGAQNNADSYRQKKACIKMEKDENGTVTKIDTCVTAATDEELKQKLDALGFGDMPEVPPVPGVPPVPPVPPLPPIPPGEDGKEVTMTKVIVIDDGEDSDSGRKNAKTRKEKKGEAYSYSYSTNDGADADVVVIDGNGHVMKTRSGSGKDNNVVIKKMKPGEQMDPEVEKIMKEHGVEMKDGEAHQIIIKNEENKNGKQSKEVKVFVFNKMEVKNLSAEDKKRLPENANKAIEKASPLANLTMSPNPTDDACNVSYKATSKEPLEISVYNMEGKTVYTETDKNVSEQVNKTISLKELGKGIYFVHLTQGKQSEVRKVIVK